MQPVRSCRPQDGQKRLRCFQSSRLFWMPDRVMSKAMQTVEAKSPSTCGSSDITLFSTVSVALKPGAASRGGGR